MADPATITLTVKAAIAAATNKRTWEAVGMVIAAILTPFMILPCQKNPQRSAN